MKVAIYYPWVYLHGGPERVLSEIVARSRHEWTIITNRYERDCTFPELRSANIVELPRVTVRRSFRGVTAAAWRIATQRLPVEGHDVFMVLCEGLGDLGLLRRYGVPAACLCLTPLRAAFDAHYQANYPEMASRERWRKIILAAGAFAFRQFDRLLWKRYDRVFAISREVGRRIIAGGLYPADRIEYVNPGVDLTRLEPSWIYNNDFVIPGRIMWTKNLQLAIDAFQLLLSGRPDLHHWTMTFAGYLDRKSQSYLSKLRERAAGNPQIRFVVSPSDEQLFQICQSAYAVVYPPFNEDWGIAPIEGMALGKPVIAVNRGGPRETIVHGETGYLLEPVPEQFAAAMEHLADSPDLVRSLGKRARLRAARFDWQVFVSQLDHGLEELAANHGILPHAAVPAATVAFEESE